VAKKGAVCPIFEGDMPPKKMYPQYWHHNLNPVNTLNVLPDGLYGLHLHCYKPVPTYLTAFLL
jgi:hypothetical protein